MSMRKQIKEIVELNNYSLKQLETDPNNKGEYKAYYKLGYYEGLIYRTMTKLEELLK